MAYQPKSMSEFQSIVIKQLKRAFPEFNTMGVNMRFVRSIQTPAAFVELTDFSYPSDLAYQSSSLDCCFSLRLVFSNVEELPSRVIEDFAIQFARFTQGNRWKMDCSPAKVVSSSSDDFSPTDETYRAWEIRFQQNVNFEMSETVVC